MKLPNTPSLVLAAGLAFTACKPPSNNLVDVMDRCAPRCRVDRNFMYGPCSDLDDITVQNHCRALTAEAWQLIMSACVTVGTGKSANCTPADEKGWNCGFTRKPDTRRPDTI